MVLNADAATMPPLSVSTSAMPFSPVRLGQTPTAPPPFDFASGPFVGRDVSGVIEEAIRFWEDYFTAIERDIARAE